jgi:hypothetical protein
MYDVDDVDRTPRLGMMIMMMRKGGCRPQSGPVRRSQHGVLPTYLPTYLSTGVR